MAKKYVKVKHAKYGWRRAGDSLVRTLSVDEGEHFKETGELPRVGNVSSIPQGGFGWIWMQPTPDPTRVTRIVRSIGRWMLTRRIIKRFNALERWAKIMIAHDRQLLTADEAAKLAADVNGRFNATMKRLGLGARIEFKTADSVCLKELWPGAGMEAMDFLTTIKHGPDVWCLPYLEDLMMCMLNPASPTRPEAKREWDARLRQTQEGKAFRAAETVQQGIDQQADEGRKEARAVRDQEEGEMRRGPDGVWGPAQDPWVTEGFRNEAITILKPFRER
jgi:hypothetical protein